MPAPKRILVVGAGPTGLTLAADLASRGHKVRLIDLASGPRAHSRALGVQAGTLLALADAFGPEFSQALVAAGQPVRELAIHLNDGSPIPVPLQIDPPYPFILI